MKPPTSLMAEWMLAFETDVADEGRNANERTRRDSRSSRTLPTALSPLLLGGDSGERAAFLLFEPGTPHPVLVLKTARDPTGRETLENEDGVLRELLRRYEADRSAGSAAIGAFTAAAARPFPEARGFLRHGRTAAFLQEAVPGATWFHRMRASSGMNPTAIERLVRAILDFLQSLGQLPPSDAVPSPPVVELHRRWTAAIEALASILTRERNAPPDRIRFLETLTAKIPGLPPPPLQHGDLFPKNVMLPDPENTEGFVLIDWADAGRCWPPLFDEVLLFATLWWEGTGTPSETERLRHFRNIFWGETPFRSLVDETFVRGMNSTDLGDGWSREEVVLLALSVYGQRLAERSGHDHYEYKVLMRNIESVLERALDRATPSP